MPCMYAAEGTLSLLYNLIRISFRVSFLSLNEDIRATFIHFNETMSYSQFSSIQRSYAF
jgi:hypothetical protein